MTFTMPQTFGLIFESTLLNVVVTLVLVGALVGVLVYLKKKNG